MVWLLPRGDCRCMVEVIGRRLIHGRSTHPRHGCRSVGIRIQRGRRYWSGLPRHVWVLGVWARPRIQSLRLRIGEASRVGSREVLRWRLGSHGSTSRVRLILSIRTSLCIFALHWTGRGRAWRHPLHLRMRYVRRHCVSPILVKLRRLRGHGLRASRRWCTAEDLGECGITLKG